jgi:RND family efflux transporter MFP subunit
MKRTKFIVSFIVIIIVIIVILINNRAKIKAEETVRQVDVYPVTIDTAFEKYLTQQLNLVGTIEANNDVPIVSEAQGKVINVFAEVGDYKKAGSTLIQLDDILEQAAFQTAQANYEKSKKDFERYQALYKGNSATDAQFENAKLAYQTAEAQYITSKKAYEDTKIKTPISGIVTSRNVDFGDYVLNHTVVADVVDIATLKVIINVSEQNVFNLKVGDKVQILTDIYPGVIFEGRIKTISVKGDAAHSYPVEVDFSNSKEHPLKAGMFAHIIFNSISKTKTVVIPRSALIGSVKDAQVFVDENGIAKLRNLVIGNTSDNYLEVLSGLKPGEIVVVNGQNNLKDNYKIKIVK